MKLFDGKRVLVTGATGSLGDVLTRRLLAGVEGTPKSVTVFSRDETKQHFMRTRLHPVRGATDLRFRIGDVREYASVVSALRDADIVVNASALKQVPTCEYFPYEAVRTNIGGAENIVRAIEEHGLAVEVVVGISTDKACKPVNTMGMTKAIQERIFIQGNLRCPSTRFVCVRYGNVLASRGSVIPLFRQQIQSGGPVTLTSIEMTRFLLDLDDAVDAVFGAIRHARRGEIFVPRAPAARVKDVAAVLIGDRSIPISIVGIRPGEKVHEILVTEEEAPRARQQERWYAIAPMLPELHESQPHQPASPLMSEYSSSQHLLSLGQVSMLLTAANLATDSRPFVLRDELSQIS